MRSALLVIPLVAMGDVAAGTVAVGSKNFTESYLLAEIVCQLLEAEGHEVNRRLGFGGTKVCYEALIAGEIDLYPEYTGTIREVILDGGSDTEIDALNRELAPHGLRAVTPLGFNNTYAIAVAPEIARDRGLRRISDLAREPDLGLGFSHEFRDRRDGWPGLAALYELPQQPSGIEHGLAYQAIAQGRIDVTDAYSTDGDIERYGLVLLEDDRGYFPDYLAVLLTRNGLPAAVRQRVRTLEGILDDASMRALNARVVVDGQPIPAVASEFLTARGLIRETVGAAPLWQRLAKNSARHLKLTAIALALACLFGVTAALLTFRHRGISGPLLYVAGLLQTIPSIALLALMIPLFGVGQWPAIVALFLYSLLPVVRSTVTALVSIDPVYRRVAAAMGMSRLQELRHVLVPLALPHIIAGVRTAAVISIGTATLAAFIGAGGLGEPIVTGLALNDSRLILEGAIPAALLAIGTELGFDGLERRLVPAHMRSRNLAV
jgi:osmoprotectant transport system permease protein